MPATVLLAALVACACAQGGTETNTTSYNRDALGLGGQVSSSLAGFKRGLPRKTLDNQAAPTEFEASREYGESLVVVAIPGIAAAAFFFLSLFVFLCLRCAGKCGAPRKASFEDEGDFEDGEAPPDPPTLEQKQCTAIALGALFVPVVFAAALAWATTTNLSDGVDLVIDSLESASSDTVGLGESFQTQLRFLATDLPMRLTASSDNLTGVDPLGDRIVEFRDRLEALGTDIQLLSLQLDAIDSSASRNLSQTSALQFDTESLRAESASVIANASALATEVNEQLRVQVDQSRADLAAQISDVEQATDDLDVEVADVVREVREVNDQVVDSSDTAKKYESYRATLVILTFVTAVLLMMVAFLGMARNKRRAISCGVYFTFVAMSMLWLLFGLHLPIGVVLEDFCQDPEAIVQRELNRAPQDVIDAVNGCLDGVSLYETLDVSQQLNVTELFSQTSALDSFEEFVDGQFDISQQNVFLDQASNLTTYNLTSDIESVSPATFGFNATSIQQSLDVLNELGRALGLFYTVQNVSLFDPAPYAVGPERTSAWAAANTTETLIEVNATVTQAVQDLKANLTAVQTTLDGLGRNVTELETRLAVIEDGVDLLLVNITYVDEAVSFAEESILEFQTIGDCGFVAEAQDATLKAMCTDVVASADMTWFCGIWIACMLLAVLPLLICAERRFTPVEEDYLKSQELDDIIRGT